MAFCHCKLLLRNTLQIYPISCNTMLTVIQNAFMFSVFCFVYECVVLSVTDDNLSCALFWRQLAMCSNFKLGWVLQFVQLDVWFHFAITSTLIFIDRESRMIGIHKVHVTFYKRKVLVKWLIVNVGNCLIFLKKNFSL